MQAFIDETVSIGQIVNDGGKETYYVAGSGLLVGLNEHKGVIVTAKHVVFDPAQGWHPSQLMVRFSWQEHKSNTEELGVPLILVDSGGKNLWSSASDGADVVVIPFPDADPKAQGVNAKVNAAWPGLFGTDDDLYDGAQVIILGFPVLMGQEYLVRPIVRSGIVAWTNPDEPANKPFLVDANLYPGNSGGPVFRLATGIDREVMHLLYQAL